VITARYGIGKRKWYNTNMPIKVLPTDVASKAGVGGEGVAG